MFSVLSLVAMGPGIDFTWRVGFGVFINKAFSCECSAVFVLPFLLPIFSTLLSFKNAHVHLHLLAFLLTSFFRSKV